MCLLYEGTSVKLSVYPLMSIPKRLIIIDWISMPKNSHEDVSLSTLFILSFWIFFFFFFIYSSFVHYAAMENIIQLTVWHYCSGFRFFWWRSKSHIFFVLETHGYRNILGIKGTKKFFWMDMLLNTVTFEFELCSTLLWRGSE